MRTIITTMFITAWLIYPPHDLSAQINLAYQKPAKEILDIVDAPLPPTMEIKSSGEMAILMYRRPFRTIEELSQPEMRLAGLRINPITNISSRQRTTYKITLFDIENKKEKEIAGLPEGQFSNLRWSKNEEKLALTNTDERGVALWIIDTETAMAKRITEPRINANLGRPYEWLNDDELLVKFLPSDRIPLIDEELSVPSGPVISENAGKKAQNRTYQDLLKSPADERNFESLAQSSLHVVSVDGLSREWKGTDMYRSVSVSPDGRFVLVNVVQRPFSYIVPYYRFPTETDLYRADGAFIRNIAQVPLIEELPKGFMATHIFEREIGWRSDKRAEIFWVKALDGGDPSSNVETRDGLYLLSEPFDDNPKLIATTSNRFSDVTWGEATLAVVEDSWFSNRNTKTYLIDPSGGRQQRVIFDRNYQDRYSDPGDFVTRKNAWGEDVLHISGETIFLEGPGYSSDGVHPFIDAYGIEDGNTTRLYQSQLDEQYERIREVLNLDEGMVLVSIESPSEYPNFYLRNIRTGTVEKVTNFQNPFESIQNVHKELIEYDRDDGVKLSGTLYLPSGYDRSSGQKLPMLLWAYPVEYKDKQSAGQITSSPFQFTYPSYGSPIFWITRGFAVLDRAAFPIVGEDDIEPNDSFRKQLVANAKAAIDAVDKMGYIDRTRVGVGGHSYGAFMTANLLSHSDLFAAGIARSGAYNRTLTPFGFQREERSYWEAPEVYYNMSPFMHADKMKTPLLLIHGEADNNSGTYPMQSERYFNALKGLGATVRLVMLPKESHGYSARESILHMLWEQDQWLEKYVKYKYSDETKP